MILVNIFPLLQIAKMDAALLAEREAFKRRAMAVPTIENKKRKTDTGSKGKASSEHNSGQRKRIFEEFFEQFQLFLRAGRV
jgi:hypothetical protein